MIWKPTRSASRSASRLKLSWRWIARPCPPISTPIAASGLACARQRRQDHGRQRHQRVLLLLAQHARDVALRDVADLVRHHRGQFRLGLRRQQQRRVHADEAARQRERVERRDRAPRRSRNRSRSRRARRAGASTRPSPKLFRYSRIGVVVEVIAVAPDVAHDFLAQLALDQRATGPRARCRRASAAGSARRRWRTVCATGRQCASSTRRRPSAASGVAWREAENGIDFTML